MADCSRCEKLLKIIEKVQINCDCCLECPKAAQLFCYHCNLYLCHSNQVHHHSTHKIIRIGAIPALDIPQKVVDCDGELWGIAFNNNGSKWAVADNSNHCVYIYNNHDCCVQTIGSKGIKDGEFQHPEGITFDSSNHLYVVDNSNHRVQKFNVDSTHVRVTEVFGSQGKRGGQLDYPHGITTYDDVVYIADTGNRRISVFKTNGMFCNNFGSEHLRTPHDVAVLRNKQQLLVADYELHCIHIFTLDGKYVKNFGTRGHGENQMNCPYSLTTYSDGLDGYIVLADTRNHRMQIFKDDNYQCIHCFGSYGSENGQFDSPSGIAVSPNG